MGSSKLALVEIHTQRITLKLMKQIVHDKITLYYQLKIILLPHILSHASRRFLLSGKEFRKRNNTLQTLS